MAKKELWHKRNRSRREQNIHCKNDDRGVTLNLQEMCVRQQGGDGKTTLGLYWLERGANTVPEEFILM